MEQGNANNLDSEGSATIREIANSVKEFVAQKVRLKHDKKRYDYDIFVSYKQDWGDVNNNNIKSIGCAVARSIVQPLKQAGYSVYFDCDIYDKKKLLSRPMSRDTIPMMDRSRLIIIVLTDFCFENMSDGFAAELNKAKEMKDRLLVLSIDNTFNSSIKKKLKGDGYDYSWLLDADVKRRDLFLNQNFQSNIKSLLKSLRSSAVGPRISPLRSLVYGLACALVFCLFYVGTILLSDNKLIIAGGGTAKAFLEKELGFNVEHYKWYKRASVYLHMPSENAAVLLAEAAKDRASQHRNVPIILSAERFDSEFLSKYLDTSSFKKKARVFQFECGSVNPQVLIYAKKYGSVYPHVLKCNKDTNISLNIEDLRELIMDPTTFLVTTNSHSGTYHYYATALSSNTLPTLDSLVGLKVRDSLWGEFSPGVSPYFLSAKTGRKSVNQVVVLQNEYYDIRKIAELIKMDTDIVEIVGSLEGSNKIPIYLYTVMSPIIVNDFTMYEVPEKTMQCKFLKRVGVSFHVVDSIGKSLIYDPKKE